MILFEHRNIIEVINESFEAGDVQDFLTGKIYISGPITGIKNWQEMFSAAENELVSLPGTFFIVNPLTLSITLEKEFKLIGKSEPSYSDYMRRDLSRLLECDTICMLPGWQKSKGARFEYHLARLLGMAILEYIPN